VRIGAAAAADTSGQDRYGAELFLRRAGVLATETAPALEKLLACDGSGCVGLIGSQAVAITRSASALAADCRRADVVVFLGRAPPREAARCADAHLISTRGDLRRPRAVRLSAHGVEIETASPSRRPWGPAPARSPEPMIAAASRSGG
ncbi:MAG: hypothetical protein MI723_00575, partial [Caulobacterales bacterium]|nr:hypothetical protein [Caulobacterales bacterium]